WGKALHYWGVAGKAAMDRASYVEAIGLFGKALQAGLRVWLWVEGGGQVVDLCRALNWGGGARGGLAAMVERLRDAGTSAARLGLARLKCELRTQRAHFESIYGGNVISAIRCGRGALRMAQASGNSELLAAARFALGQAHWLTGEYRLAIEEIGADAEA